MRTTIEFTAVDTFLGVGFDRVVAFSPCRGVHARLARQPVRRRRLPWTRKAQDDL